MIAPDGNRSATARSITTRRPLWVERVDFDDGTHGYATDGTPVDCVRLAALGLIEGFEPELVVSGINHGANLGDDITYSGTVAAALEGIVLGLPAIAVSQQSTAREMDFRARPRSSTSTSAARSPRASSTSSTTSRCRRARCSTSTCPARRAGGRRGRAAGQAHLPRRARARSRRTTAAAATGSTARDPGFHDEPGTDLAAVAAGRIAVTPLHFDLTDDAGMDALRALDLARLLAPAARGGAE